VTELLPEYGTNVCPQTFPIPNSEIRRKKKEVRRLNLPLEKAVVDLGWIAHSLLIEIFSKIDSFRVLEFMFFEISILFIIFISEFNNTIIELIKLFNIKESKQPDE
jgi:hypothetical protein